MLSRVVVSGIVLVMLLAAGVCLIEFFVPLSAKIRMNACCRSALMTMEAEGGLTQQNSSMLEDRLSESGFSNIEITGTACAPRGDALVLNVSADYLYTRMTGFFTREQVVQPMSYERVSAARKVVN